MIEENGLTTWNTHLKKESILDLPSWKLGDNKSIRKKNRNNEHLLVSSAMVSGLIETDLRFKFSFFSIKDKALKFFQLWLKK